MIDNGFDTVLATDRHYKLSTDYEGTVKPCLETILINVSLGNKVKIECNNKGRYAVYVKKQTWGDL